MKETGKVVLSCTAFAFAVMPLLSQTESPKKPSFEVISIKPSPPGNGPRGILGFRGDRFTMNGATVRMLLQFAYRRRNDQMIGGPSWIDYDRFDVQAKADCNGGALSQDQMQLMLQSLLEDRFQLKVHSEKREVPTYNLVVAKNGPKMKLSEDQSRPIPQGTPPPPPCAPPSAADAAAGQRGILPPFDPRGPIPRGVTGMSGSPSGGLTMTATAVPISNLVNMLQGWAGRPIIDNTDLQGLFDFELQFSPEGLPNLPTQFGPIPAPRAGPGGPAGIAVPGASPVPASDPAPSLFTAIQEQLGLKLESTRGPVDVLLIDSVQKPTEN